MAIITWQNLVKEEFKETNVLRVLRKTNSILPVELQQLITIEYELAVFKKRVKLCQKEHRFMRNIFAQILDVTNDDDLAVAISFLRNIVLGPTKTFETQIHPFELAHVYARQHLVRIMQLKHAWAWRQTANFPGCDEKHVKCASGSVCGLFHVEVSHLPHF